MPTRSRRPLLLDSGVVSAYLSENQKYRELRNEIARHLQGKKLCSCSIVEGELFVWADRLGTRRHENFKAFLENMDSFPVTTATARCYASEVWKTADIGKNDRWIGSVIMDHDLDLITLDSDFTRCEFLSDRVTRLDPNQYRM